MQPPARSAEFVGRPMSGIWEIEELWSQPSASGFRSRLMAMLGADVPVWTLVVADVVPVLAVAVGLYLGLKELAVKAKSDAVQADVKLLEAFANLGRLANGRGEPFLSESVASKIAEQWDGTGDLDLRDAVVDGPVGAAQQAALIAAIAGLAERHPQLREPALASLRGLADIAKDGTPAVQRAYADARLRVGLAD